MLSDDSKVLSAKEEELAEAIVKKRQENKDRKAKTTTKRARTQVKPQGVASDRAVAQSLGMKVPVPKHLEGEVNAAKKDLKSTKDQKSKGQKSLDTMVASKIVSRNLFSNVKG